MDLIINRRHATQGIVKSSKECPTAIALRSAGFPLAEVGGSCIFPEGAMNWQSALPMTVKLRRAVANFDKTGRFKIGVYRIPGLKRPKT